MEMETNGLMHEKARTQQEQRIHEKARTQQEQRIQGLWFCTPVSNMELLQGMLNLIVPPAVFILLLLLYPMLCFVSFCRWILGFIFPENVEGKVVLLIGASSGIGEQLAYEYAKRRAKLMLVARRANELNGVAQQAHELGATVVRTQIADVSSQDECRRAIEKTVHVYGRIDHLVCNAGIAHAFKVEEAQSPQVMRRIIETNLYGAGVYPAYYAIPHLRRSRGKIVVTASVTSFLYIPRMAVYTASKAAMFNFFETLRVELGSQVGMTIAIPGYIQSGMTVGNFMAADGPHEMDLDARDVMVGPSPVTSTGYCAKSIISAVLRGRRYVVVPAWYKVALLFRLFAPELLDVLLRLFFVKEVRPGKPITKAVMDTFPAVEKVAYPAGMQQKTE